MRGPSGYLRHRALCVDHGFGTRAAPAPDRWLHPRQVHGITVALVDGAAVTALGEADAVVSTAPGAVVGIVTADCVPILVGQHNAVAAIHAGWRGLAKGVIEAAIAVLDRAAGSPEDRVAVIGPHICAQHYEVDVPVREALIPGYGAALDDALTPTRAGHWHLDLNGLTHDALRRAGLGAQQIFALGHACTYGDAQRFASRRRDGPGGERLSHWVATPAPTRASAGDDRPLLT
jgi:YfiH family protein